MIGKPTTSEPQSTVNNGVEGVRLMVFLEYVDKPTQEGVVPTPKLTGNTTFEFEVLG